PFSIAQLLLHLGYLNTFFGYPWLQDVYWTLGIEFQYYLFVALIYPFLTVRRPVIRAVAMAVLAGTPMLIETPILVFHWLGLFPLGMLAFQYHVALLRGKVMVPAVAIVVTGITISHSLPEGLAAG